MHNDPAWTEGTAVTSVRSDVIPAPRNKEKTTPPSGNDKYGKPPSKYGPTRWAYGPTQYKMGLTATTFTSKAS